MVVNPRPWTTRDLAAMPDDWGWTRYEIIDGELYVTRAPHIRHQGVAGKIQFVLEAWSRQTKLGSPFQAPGVIFSPVDAVIPDVVWISHARMAHGLDDAGHLTVAPELMVEVLSPGDSNEQRDKDIKLNLYSRYGVQEYWIVNWQQKTVAVYRRQSAQLILVGTLLAGDALTSPLLPGFTASLSEIFQG
ncbi:hypothetical protein GFS31_40280 [Leptolyngbya sp. BL0902]|uniref:Uma2 family endonuclease n=1 Tax=Leptolyngbya sp. BL0902 TaxID=1115757 RepID=UPI0018E7A1CC|nr:Uma2 family endonuclease [Leptolyngbya sp. BL0902]QQE67315.1 hypothetical protein GFS31_40280 [Leptolyngbya sp. BL0902]